MFDDADKGWFETNRDSRYMGQSLRRLSLLESSLVGFWHLPCSLSSFCMIPRLSENVKIASKMISQIPKLTSTDVHHQLYVASTADLAGPSSMPLAIVPKDINIDHSAHLSRGHHIHRLGPLGRLCLGVVVVDPSLGILCFLPQRRHRR